MSGRPHVSDRLSSVGNVIDEWLQDATRFTTVQGLARVAAVFANGGPAMAVGVFVDALDPDAIQRTERGAEGRDVTMHYDEVAGTA